MWRWMPWRRAASPKRPAASSEEHPAPVEQPDRAPPLSRFPLQASSESVNHSRERSAGGQAVSPERMFSADAVRRAWLAVKRAGGGAGMDGVTIVQFEAQLEQELAELQRLLASGQYRPKPVRQVWAPKAHSGMRPLALWALRDRVAQRVIYDLLSPIFETQFLPCSFGFRPGLGVQDAVAALQRQRDAGCGGWWTLTSRIVLGRSPPTG